jgi:hypothetical protein
MTAIEDVVIEDTVSYWSSPATWNGTVPVEGDDIIMESGKNIVYDLEGDSPIYNKIEINGRLTFLDDGKDRHLRAKYIFVRSGELIIGN